MLFNFVVMLKYVEREVWRNHQREVLYTFKVHGPWNTIWLRWIFLDEKMRSANWLDNFLNWLVDDVLSLGQSIWFGPFI